MTSKFGPQYTDFDPQIYIRGCTSGGVYAPCIYEAHARWELVTVDDSRSLLLQYLCYVFRELINSLVC